MSARTQAAALAALDRAASRWDAAATALANAAQAYAKAETLAYSKAHPRREVQFCAAMGSTTLHVSRGGTCGRSDDYQLGGYSADIGEPPEFMRKLAEIDQDTEFGKGWLAGPLAFICKGGRVVSDRSDW